MSADHTAIDNALHAWVAAASGIAPEKVIWDSQKGTRPTDDFITLKRGDTRTVGAFDQMVDETDLTRPAGEEVELRIEGLRDFTLRIQAFAREVEGNTSAPVVLGKVQIALGLPSVQEALSTAGLSPTFDRGVVQNVPNLLGTSRFESRAVVDIGFYFVDTVSEFTGYFDSVSGEGAFSGTVDPSGVIVFDLP